jgi:hypothetical protein
LKKQRARNIQELPIKHGGEPFQSGIKMFIQSFRNTQRYWHRERMINGTQLISQIYIHTYAEI